MEVLQGYLICFGIVFLPWFLVWIVQQAHEIIHTRRYLRKIEMLEEQTSTIDVEQLRSRLEDLRHDVGDEVEHVSNQHRINRQQQDISISTYLQLDAQVQRSKRRPKRSVRGQRMFNRRYM